jgi:CheY-like chemotaxis protein
LGLGLALVKSLVELHGGAVAAQSGGLGAGSEFTVRLPRLIGPAAQPEYQHDNASHHAHGNPLRVMIVDDNIDAAQILAAFLEAVGHQVSVANDSASALGLARREAPQVLVLDIGLPDMDGHELARRFRLLPQTADAVLIALTGYGQPEDQARSRSAGFDYHLTKPADPTKLAALLSEINARY